METISQAYLGEILNSYLSHYYEDPNSFLSTISEYEHFRKLRITNSEYRLLSSIFESGKAIGLDNPNFFNIKEDNLILKKDEVVRSEVLELLFRIMQDHPNIFNKNDILFKGITIMRMKDYVALFLSQSKNENENECKLKEKRILEDVKPHYALDISHRKIDFDLKFQNCTFLGGLNISDSEFLSLVIDSCQFGQSKDVSISNEIILNGNVNYCSINSRRTAFKGIVKIFSKQEKSLCVGDICFSNIHSSSNIELGSIICKNLDFSGAKVNELKIDSCEITGQIDFSSLKGYSIGISNSYIQNSNFGIVLDDVQLNFIMIWNSFVLGGISIDRCTIEKYLGVGSSLVASRCFLYAKYKKESSSSAIEGYKANISEIFIRDGSVLLGSLETISITIDNIYLDRSRIISYDKYPAIDLRNSNIKDTIYFGLTIADIKSKLDKFHAEESDFYFGHKIFLKENRFGFRTETFKTFKSKLKDDVLYKALIKGEKEFSEKQLIDCKFKEEDISQSFKDNLDKYDLSRVDIEYSIFIGGVNCSSIHVGRSVSTNGAIFIDGYTDRKIKPKINIQNQSGEKQKKEEPTFTNEISNLTEQQQLPTEIYKIDSSIDFSNSIIQEDLYLQGGKLKWPNSFDNDTLFEFIPLTKEVILKSTTVRRLHLSFNEKLFEYHIKKNPWNIFGLKYDFLITRSNDEPSRKIVKSASWFKDDPKRYEAIQPYEQVASAFLNRGKFEEAVKMQIKGKLTLAWEKFKPVELILYSLINILARLGLPSSRAFSSLLVIFGVQLLFWSPCWDWAAIPYVFGEMVPLNILEFTPPEGFIENAEMHPFTRIILYDIVSMVIKIISYIFFAMFVVGLSRITRKQSLGLD